jgi:hypothetical protein
MAGRRQPIGRGRSHHRACPSGDGRQCRDTPLFRPQIAALQCRRRGYHSQHIGCARPRKTSTCSGRAAGSYRAARAGSSAHHRGRTGVPSSANQPCPFHQPVTQSLLLPGPSRHGPKISPCFTGAFSMGDSLMHRSTAIVAIVPASRFWGCHLGALIRRLNCRIRYVQDTF